ncbi:MAG: metallophosphoesterase [Candidatus Thiodiazotropha sp. (ex Lucinoma aequizonata)]|nr:metallophosphoesterase [Candidatus Thiodiazotropha sp. (ex Lucinoma aequizonata)]MCU7887528.1 metallophosphoesterase [Candidatus Thiodiazotropha sp. (ex Lucinoma aequizonata)]MCU7896318.1 metallophosphoesterase [Candidatus Thiodiazotropha sp. (ex Lucinoma aequizonata)]MCU7897852.1 metallophosphoesterase [Candidatus Thiodiazotropha sp. (ex Lucinoma aequizonata)]MCU7903682.1 metallophosphoesterase [Candidatus Thiodiazotropha sp. (ex Lucinoma aequizonata)]
MRFHSRFHLSAVGLLFVALMAGIRVSTADTGKKILYTWSQLVPGGQMYSANAQIRAIVDKSVSCSDVTVTGINVTVKMTQRDQPDLPEFFSFSEINLCTSILTGHTIDKSQSVTVSFNSENNLLNLPDISDAVTLDSFVIIGDTGCRGNISQSCASKKLWPFANLLGNIKKKLKDGSPTVILHVGDYRYSNPYIDGRKLKANIAGKPDYWATSAGNGKPAHGGWKSEVIEPLSVLSSQGPWIFLRGNHEQCYSSRDYGISRETGEAYLYFFGYEDDKLGDGDIRCTDKDFLDPYAIDFKHKSGKMRLIVMDLIHKTQDGNNKGYVKEQLADFTNQFNSIEQMITDQGPSVTLLTHHIPTFSLKNGGKSKKSQFNANHITTDALKRSNLVTGDEAFVHIPLIFSGHAHNFQLVQPDKNGDLPNRPVQYVIGNSGVNLTDRAISGKMDVEWKPFNNNGKQKKSSTEEKWHTFREKKFGYLIGTFSNKKSEDTLSFVPYQESESAYTSYDNGKCFLTYSDDANSGKVDCPKLK